MELHVWFADVVELIYRTSQSLTGCSNLKKKKMYTLHTQGKIKWIKVCCDQLIKNNARMTYNARINEIWYSRRHYMHNDGLHCTSQLPRRGWHSWVLACKRVTGFWVLDCRKWNTGCSLWMGILGCKVSRMSGDSVLLCC
jgi:hypothetical protein